MIICINLKWKLTNNNEDIGVGRCLEEGRLPRHLTPELAAGGEVHIPQHNPRLRRLVFLWIDVQKSEFCLQRVTEEKRLRARLNFKG